MKALKPDLRARFVLEKDGTPSKITDANGLKHYRIELFVKDVDSGVDTVTYDLDPTYLDSKREVPGNIPGFSERITSYGDYRVTATAMGHAGAGWSVKKLSEALRAEHATPDGAIAEALRDIEKH